MAKTAWPLDDTPYVSQNLRLWHIGRTAGVVNATGSDFKVTPDGINVTVSPGFAHLKDAVGSYGSLVFGSTESEHLIGQVADTTDRYDYVSVRYTKSDNAVDIHYVVGTNQRPTPVRTSTVWELIVAIIHVRANSSSITANDIEDTRMNQELCGFCVDNLQQIPTDTYEEQLREFVTNEQSTFNVWFETIKGQLDEDAAGHLQNEIDEINTQLSALQSTVTTALAEINTKLESIVFWESLTEEEES
ncbi:MAG: hypothetical protein J6D36_01820 [Erysipelotrichaceae bacterium]|nr:hypothetical protein [Erysipelotrichaceae bacterium]